MKLGNIFHKKKQLSEIIPFDAEKQTAVLRCSICTGEQVAGFKSREDGTFTEVMVVKSDADLTVFKRTYGIETVKKEY